MVAYHGEISEPAHYFKPNHPLDWAVIIFLLVSQELQRIDQVVANSLRRIVCSKHCCFSTVRAVYYDENSIWSPPIVLV